MGKIAIFDFFGFGGRPLSEFERVLPFEFRERKETDNDDSSMHQRAKGETKVAHAEYTVRSYVGGQISGANSVLKIYVAWHLSSPSPCPPPLPFPSTTTV